MAQHSDHPTAERRLAQIFISGEALKRGVVERQVRDAERQAGRAAFVAEVARRGCESVPNGRRFVVFSNGHPIRRVR